jgi:hypothetical protein
MARRTGGRAAILTLALFLAAEVGPCPLGGPSAARAGEPPPGYFVLPVTTALQRELVPPKTDVCVVLDASRALREEEVTPGRLGLDRLGAELRKLKVDRTTLHFHVFHGNLEPKRNLGRDRDGASRMCHYAVIGFAHELGFAKVTASGTVMVNGAERAWEVQAEPLLRKGAPKDGPEPAAGDADVKVYPVRTALSRYLESNADCVVFIVPALDTDSGGLPSKYRAVAAKAVTDLKLPDRKRINFHIRRGSLTAEEAAQLQKDLNDLGEDLGSVGGYVTGG